MHISDFKECQRLISSKDTILSSEDMDLKQKILDCDKLIKSSETSAWIAKMKNQLNQDLAIRGTKIESYISKGDIKCKDCVQDNVLNDGQILIVKQELKAKSDILGESIIEYTNKYMDESKLLYEQKNTEQILQSSLGTLSSQISYANSAYNQANSELRSAEQRYTYNSCWGGRSPELNHSCIQSYRNQAYEKLNALNNLQSRHNSVQQELSNVQHRINEISRRMESLNNESSSKTSQKATYENQGSDLSEYLNKLQELKEFESLSLYISGYIAKEDEDFFSSFNDMTPGDFVDDAKVEDSVIEDNIQNSQIHTLYEN